MSENQTHCWADSDDHESTCLLPDNHAGPHEFTPDRNIAVNITTPSDINKCTDIKCPSKDNCYRYTAKPERVQSYADFNREPDAEKCEHFWPIEERNAQPT